MPAGPRSGGAVAGPRSALRGPGAEPPAGGHPAGDAGYDRSRGAVARALTPGMVHRLAPRVQRIADELLEAACDAGDVNLVEALGYPLAASVFCEVFGIPPADRAVFRTWVDAIVRGVDSVFGISREERADRDRAGQEFGDYFLTLIADRRKRPADDLLTALIGAAGGDGGLGEHELVSTCVMV